METAEGEYSASTLITENPTKRMQQQQDIFLYDSVGTVEKVKVYKKTKDQFLQKKFKVSSDPLLRR